MKSEDLKILRAPFSKENLGVKVQSFSKDRTRAMLVLYLQHTDVQARLEEVDPAWSFEVVHEERSGDTVYIRGRLTLKGVSRENVGEGSDPKSAHSDALKRCAMLFGVGRYLYDSPTAWTEYNDARDRFKQWSAADYEKAAKSPVPTPETTASAATTLTEDQPRAEPPVKPKRSNSATDSPGLKTKIGTKTREQLNRRLMNLYRPYLSNYPETKFVELLHGRYNVGETRLMTLEQLEDLARFMEQQLENQNTASA